MNIKWTKRPSVIRDNKWFYAGERGNGKMVFAVQDWQSNKWHVRYGDDPVLPREFETAQQAMKSVTPR